MRLLGAWGVVSSVFSSIVALLAISVVACSSGSHSKRKPPLDESLIGPGAFTRYESLGSLCNAAVASEPAAAYGPLSLIPCRSGELGCEELKWDGALSWSPTGSNMMQFSLDVALDARGRATRLLVTSQYPHSKQTSGTPFEAVAYDLASGKPLAAWRNAGDTWDTSDDDGRVSIGGSVYCTISVRVTDGHAFLLATPSDSKDVYWSSSALEEAASHLQLQKLDVDRSVIFGSIQASRNTAALEQEDGKLVHIDLGASQAVSTYGPTQRLRLETIAGDEVVASASVGAGPFQRLNADGSFTKYAITGQFLRGDELHLTWLVATDSALEVWSAPRAATDPAAEAKRIAVLEGTRKVLAVTLADSTFAVQSAWVDPRLSSSLSWIEQFDVHLVNLDTGQVSQRTFTENAQKRWLLANTNAHVWLGEAQFMLPEGKRQFQSLLRLDISAPSKACRGAPVACSQHDFVECLSAEGCSIDRKCLGKPTDPCTYPDLLECMEHPGCEYDSSNNKCLPPKSCEDVSSESSCTSTPGCEYQECAGTPKPCGAFTKDKCSKQLGCSWQ